ncbi:MAG: biotin--[acetyl-CoA-carboxylase] ligase [Deltaproteobacteria bacterium]|nr:biotin--[acetyl-CoA-carboxylase] ligase [Deltaproteobacteria bacterium]
MTQSERNPVPLSIPGVKNGPLGGVVLYFDRLESTNSWLKHHPDYLEQEGLVIFSACQTKGRGRQGRVWQGGDPGNLFTSIVIHPKTEARLIPSFSLLIGLAVREALLECGLKGLSLKWPNDVLVKDRKICGILCESRFEREKTPVIIAGIGLNLVGSTQSFTPEISGKVTTLQQEINEVVKPKEMLFSILGHLNRIILDFQQGVSRKYFDLWEKNSSSIGRRILFHEIGEKINGKILGLNEYGHLRVMTGEGKLMEIHGGEIEFL